MPHCIAHFPQITPVTPVCVDRIRKGFNDVAFASSLVFTEEVPNLSVNKQPLLINWPFKPL